MSGKSLVMMSLTGLQACVKLVRYGTGKDSSHACCRRCLPLPHPYLCIRPCASMWIGVDLPAHGFRQVLWSQYLLLHLIALFKLACSPRSLLRHSNQRALFCKLKTGLDGVASAMTRPVSSSCCSTFGLGWLILFHRSYLIAKGGERTACPDNSPLTQNLRP